MKAKVFVLAVSATAWVAGAQTAIDNSSGLAIPGPSATTSSTGSPAATLPGTGGATATSDVTGGTNTTGTNALEALSLQLSNLQAQVEQTLPAVAAFNASFNFADPNTGTAVALTNNVITPLLQSFAFGSNVLVGLDVTTNAIQSNGVNSFILPPGALVPTGTNGLASIPLSRDTLRSLLILQGDMERMLPIISALNSNTNSLAR